MWILIKPFLSAAWAFVVSLFRWLWVFQLPALLVVLALCVWAWTAWNLRSVRADVTRIESSLSDCALARDTVQQMLEKAAEAARLCIGAKHATEALEASLPAAIRQRDNASAARIAQNKQEREDVYRAYSDCNTLRFVPVCPAVSARLRELANTRAD